MDKIVLTLLVWQQTAQKMPKMICTLSCHVWKCIIVFVHEREVRGQIRMRATDPLFANEFSSWNVWTKCHWPQHTRFDAFRVLVPSWSCSISAVEEPGCFVALWAAASAVWGSHSNGEEGLLSEVLTCCPVKLLALLLLAASSDVDGGDAAALLLMFEDDAWAADASGSDLLVWLPESWSDCCVVWCDEAPFDAELDAAAVGSLRDAMESVASGADAKVASSKCAFASLIRVLEYSAAQASLEAWVMAKHVQCGACY